MAGKGRCQPQTDNRCPTVLMAGGLCLSTAVAAQRRDSRGIAVHLRVEVVRPSAAGGQYDAANEGAQDLVDFSLDESASAGGNPELIVERG
jgi:hypothetical protein